MKLAVNMPYEIVGTPQGARHSRRARLAALIELDAPDVDPSDVSPAFQVDNFVFPEVKTSAHTRSMTTPFDVTDTISHDGRTWMALSQGKDGQSPNLSVLDALDPGVYHKGEFTGEDPDGFQPGAQSTLEANRGRLLANRLIAVNGRVYVADIEPIYVIAPTEFDLLSGAGAGPVRALVMDSRKAPLYGGPNLFRADQAEKAERFFERHERRLGDMPKIVALGDAKPKADLLPLRVAYHAKALKGYLGDTTWLSRLGHHRAAKAIREFSSIKHLGGDLNSPLADRACPEATLHQMADAMAEVASELAPLLKEDTKDPLWQIISETNDLVSEFNADRGRGAAAQFPSP